MNERIRELLNEATVGLEPDLSPQRTVTLNELEKFAELIVRECRTVVSDVYRKTPLELCGPLLTADEEIAKHFYGVEE